jgi:hypothetical protein
LWQGRLRKIQPVDTVVASAAEMRDFAFIKVNQALFSSDEASDVREIWQKDCGRESKRDA